MALLNIKGYSCERCAHMWVSRNLDSSKSKLPIVCPKCKSPYWNIPKKRGGKR